MCGAGFSVRSAKRTAHLRLLALVGRREEDLAPVAHGCGDGQHGRRAAQQGAEDEHLADPRVQRHQRQVAAQRCQLLGGAQRAQGLINTGSPSDAVWLMSAVDKRRALLHCILCMCTSILPHHPCETAHVARDFVPLTVDTGWQVCCQLHEHALRASTAAQQALASGGVTARPSTAWAGAVGPKMAFTVMTTDSRGTRSSSGACCGCGRHMQADLASGCNKQSYFVSTWLVAGQVFCSRSRIMVHMQQVHIAATRAPAASLCIVIGNAHDPVVPAC